jgi:hypothetical protein
MQMKTMTAHENKTKNNRPVGIMLSIQDAADTLVPEMFMEKEAGYDDWLAAKVNKTLALGPRHGDAACLGKTSGQEIHAYKLNLVHVFGSMDTRGGELPWENFQQPVGGFLSYMSPFGEFARALILAGSTGAISTKRSGRFGAAR